METLYCSDSVPNLFGLFDSTIAPPLLYYSYIPIVIVSLLFGILVFNKSTKHLLLNKLFFGIVVSFSLFILNEIVQWIAAPVSLVHFGWQLAPLLQTSTLLLSVYFVSVFVRQGDIPFVFKLLMFAFALPVLIFLPTDLNMKLFDITNCESNIGLLFSYVYALEIISIFVVLFMCLKKYLSTTDKKLRKQLLLIGFGTSAFILMLSGSNIFGEIFKTYEINLIGPIGMVIFLGLLSYLIVRFQTFRIKLIATQALVGTLVVLIGAQFFFIQATVNFVLNGFTFIAVLIFGYLLIKTVKREIEAREKIEKLAKDLQTSNEGQSNLIHIMNHQIKGYLSKSRNIFAELLTGGDYGPVPEEAKPIIKEGFDSLTEGVGFVQQVLNGSSAESGMISYDMKPIDIKSLVEEAANKQKDTALSKGLTFEVQSEEGSYASIGDGLQLKEAFRNLIDNSIHYTLTGGLKINLSHQSNKILIKITDTGIGIADEDKPKLFTQGGRGKDSLKINVNSTGYGLLFVKAVIEAHKGRVWVESKGKNQGSTFFVELPVS